MNPDRNHERDPYEGDYLAADDIAAMPNGVTVTIERIIPAGTEKDARGQLIDQKILAFKSAGKRLILNKTNFRILHTLLGRAEADCIGKQITLCVRVLSKSFGEKDLPCLRIACPPRLMSKRIRDHYGEPFTLNA